VILQKPKSEISKKMVGKAEFAGLAGKWKQSECVGREVSGHRSSKPGLGGHGKNRAPK